MKDWNVNDSKSSGYITNRTHWKENGTEMTVGGASCGIYKGALDGEQFQGPVVEYIYADGSQNSVQLSNDITVPIYDKTIIEVMYSAPNALGERTITGYCPVEVFDDNTMGQALNYLGYKHCSYGYYGLSIRTEEYNESNCYNVWQSYGVGDIEEDWSVFGGYIPTEAQLVKIRQFINDHAYMIGGGGLVWGYVPDWSSAYDENDSSKHMLLIGPSDEWKEYWGVSDPEDNKCPVYRLFTTTANGLTTVFPFPVLSPVDPDVIDPKMYEDILGTTLGDVGKGTPRRYAPTTYHTIPLNYLPQEIQDMYAWYLENYDTIQAAIAEPSEPSEPGGGGIK